MIALHPQILKYTHFEKAVIDHKIVEFPGV